jgi:hypothetical protein
MGTELVRERAKLLVVKLESKLSEVYDEIYKIMSNPATSRGYTGKHLNLHDSYSTNSGLPMKVTGALLQSFHYKVELTQLEDTSIVSIRKWFDSVSNSKGIDYGNILDNGFGGVYGSHHILGGFKSRIKDRIDKRVLSIVRSERFK